VSGEVNCRCIYLADAENLIRKALALPNLISFDFSDAFAVAVLEGVIGCTSAYDGSGYEKVVLVFDGPESVTKFDLSFVSDFEP
jgi:hypothetical protein